jgi:hypothetical protein
MLRQLFDLGFYPQPPDPERPTLGHERPKLGKSLALARVAWDIACWILLALGIFLRQGLEFQPLSWRVERLTVGSFAASVVISLAVFPMLMRSLNRRRPRAGLLHVAVPFAFGFFLNLASVSVYRLFNTRSGTGPIR